jgi:hypothetical protein
MELTSEAIPERDLFYYRARQRNRIFEELVGFFAECAQHDGVTKKLIASRLKRDPAQVTRWLSQPSNLTLDTISDLLRAMDAELEVSVKGFHDFAVPNDIHPWATDYWVAPQIAPRRPTKAEAESKTTGTSWKPSEITTAFGFIAYG